jgi:hypothetical protein
MEQGVLYDYTYNGLQCMNLKPMQLTYNARPGYIWRCHLNSCCGKSSTSVLVDSFFVNRKIDLDKQFMILYMWLNRSSRSAIQAFLDLDLKTIRDIIQDFYQLMQEDMISGHETEEDLKIGKLAFKNFCLTY